MIDINTIFSACVSSAVNDIIQPIRAHYDAQLEALQKEITELKQQRAVSPATGEGLAKDVVQDLLENNPAIKQAVYEIAHDAAEAVMADHLEGYDHDEYDSTVTAFEDLPDFDYFVTRDDLGNAVEEKLNELVDMDEFVTKDDLPEFPDVDTLVAKDDLSDAVRESVRETLENRVSVSLYLS